MLERYFRPFEAGRSLQEQLRENLLDALLDGALAATEPLPSSRRLSALLRISRNTVVLVYDQLVQDGFLVSVHRRGYFISLQYLDDERHAAPIVAPRRPDAPDWSRHLRRHPSQLQAIVKPRNWRDYAYPFIYGQVEYDELTAARWRHCSRIASLRAHMRTWVDDQVTLDDSLLVEQIVQRVLTKRAIQARPEQVLVTVGIQNSLYLLAQLLGGPDLVFGHEDPGYVDARNIFGLAGCQTRPLSIDSDGLVVDGRMDGCGVVFCTPSHQSPTGVTMPVARRRALLERARRDDFLVIEDDYDTEHKALGGNHPALKSFDDDGRVVYLGSLTKNLFPGVRLGFIVADEELILELRALRRYMYRHPPLNNQRAMALFLSMGYHDEHARRLRDAMARKRDLIVEASRRHLPGFGWSDAAGGSSLWMQGPPNLDARALQRAAARHGVLVEPGDVHFSGDDRPRHFFRLGYGAIADERIGPGIEALARARQELGAA